MQNVAWRSRVTWQGQSRTQGVDMNWREWCLLIGKFYIGGLWNIGPSRGHLIFEPLLLLFLPLFNLLSYGFSNSESHWRMIELKHYAEIPVFNFFFKWSYYNIIHVIRSISIDALSCVIVVSSFFSFLFQKSIILYIVNKLACICQRELVYMIIFSTYTSYDLAQNLLVFFLTEFIGFSWLCMGCVFLNQNLLVVKKN